MVASSVKLNNRLTNHRELVQDWVTSTQNDAGQSETGWLGDITAFFGLTGALPGQASDRKHRKEADREG